MRGVVFKADLFSPTAPSFRDTALRQLVDATHSDEMSKDPGAFATPHLSSTSRIGVPPHACTGGGIRLFQCLADGRSGLGSWCTSVHPGVRLQPGLYSGQDLSAAALLSGDWLCPV